MALPLPQVEPGLPPPDVFSLPEPEDPFAGSFYFPALAYGSSTAQLFGPGSGGRGDPTMFPLSPLGLWTADRRMKLLQAKGLPVDSDPKQWTPEEAAQQTETALAKLATVDPERAKELAAIREGGGEDEGGFFGIPVIGDLAKAGLHVLEILSRPARIVPELLLDEGDPWYTDIAQALAGHSDAQWSKVLNKWGMPEEGPWDDILGFGLDVLTDPVMYLTGGAMGVGRAVIGRTASEAAFVTAGRSLIQAGRPAIEVAEEISARYGAKLAGDDALKELFQRLTSAKAYRPGKGLIDASSGEARLAPEVIAALEDKGLAKLAQKHLMEAIEQADIVGRFVTTRGGLLKASSGLAEKLKIPLKDLQAYLDLVRQGAGGASYHQMKAAAAALGGWRFRIWTPFNLRYVGQAMLPSVTARMDFSLVRRFFAGSGGLTRLMKAVEKGLASPEDLMAYWNATASVGAGTTTVGGYRAVIDRNPQLAKFLGRGGLHFGSVMYPLSDMVGAITAHFAPDAAALRGGGLGARMARDARLHLEGVQESYSHEAFGMTVDPSTGKLLKPEEAAHAIGTLRDADWDDFILFDESVPWEAIVDENGVLRRDIPKALDDYYDEAQKSVDSIYARGAELADEDIAALGEAAPKPMSSKEYDDLSSELGILREQAKEAVKKFSPDHTRAALVAQHVIKATHRVGDEVGTAGRNSTMNVTGTTTLLPDEKQIRFFNGASSPVTRTKVYKYRHRNPTDPNVIPRAGMNDPRMLTSSERFPRGLVLEETDFTPAEAIEAARRDGDWAPVVVNVRTPLMLSDPGDPLWDIANDIQEAAVRAVDEADATLGEAPVALDTFREHRLDKQGDLMRTSAEASGYDAYYLKHGEPIDLPEQGKLSVDEIPGSDEVAIRGWRGVGESAKSKELRSGGIHLGPRTEARGVPVQVDGRFKRVDDFDEGATVQGRDAIEQAKSEGFDGIIYKGKGEGRGDSVVVFNTEKVRHLPEQGTVPSQLIVFNPENVRALHELSPALHPLRGYHPRVLSQQARRLVGNVPGVGQEELLRGHPVFHHALLRSDPTLPFHEAEKRGVTRLSKGGAKVPEGFQLFERDPVVVINRYVQESMREAGLEMLGQNGLRMAELGFGVSPMMGSALSAIHTVALATEDVREVVNLGKEVERFNDEASRRIVKVLDLEYENANKLALDILRLRSPIQGPALLAKREAGRARKLERTLGWAGDAVNEYNRAYTLMRTKAADIKPALVKADEVRDLSGFVPLTGIKGMSDWYMHPFMAAEFSRAARGFKDLNELQKWWRRFVMGPWKEWATYRKPGFHIRNIQGAWFNNWLGGTSLQEYVLTGRIRRAAAEAYNGKDKWNKVLVGATPDMSAEAARAASERFLKKYGLLSWSRGKPVTYGNLVDEVLSPMGLNMLHGRAYAEAKLAAEVLGRGARAGKVGRAIPGWRSYDKAMMEVGDVTENYFRTAAFLTGLEVTAGDLHGARAFAMLRHGDYADLTDWEYGLLRDILPFYKWMRTNLPFQIHQLMESPAKILAVRQAMEAGFGVAGLDLEEQKKKMPEWMRDEFLMPFNVKSEDSLTYAMLDLPLSDLGKGTRDYVSAFLPMVRPFVESYLTHKTIFSQRELIGKQVVAPVFDLPIIGDFLAALPGFNRNTEGKLTVDDKIQNVLSAIPPFTQFRDVIYAEPDRAKLRANMFASLLFGVGIRPQDEDVATDVELAFYHDYVAPEINRLRSLGVEFPDKDNLAPAAYYFMGFRPPIKEEAA